MLAAMGGCEPQLRGHIQGNLNVGNNQATLARELRELIQRMRERFAEWRFELLRQPGPTVA